MRQGELVNITSKYLKSKAIEYGADLCGIASVNRFDNAPKGFHPKDLLKNAKSVVVILKKLPTGLLFCKSYAPYTKAIEIVHKELDLITFNLSLEIEQQGKLSIPIPCDGPYDFWNEKEQKSMGILSLKHAAEAAGLGKIGKNNLLTNKEFGNLVHLAALVTDKQLEPDNLVNLPFCKDKCNLCIKSCPANAINQDGVIQSLCRSKSNKKHARGFSIKDCNICRKVCPISKGLID